MLVLYATLLKTLIVSFFFIIARINERKYTYNQMQLPLVNIFCFFTGTILFRVINIHTLLLNVIFSPPFFYNVLYQLSTVRLFPILEL